MYVIIAWNDAIVLYDMYKILHMCRIQRYMTYIDNWTFTFPKLDTQIYPVKNI